MQIANPIYDAVFKFLLEDTEVAKLMLSVLLDKEIVELDFLPTEMVVKMNTDFVNTPENNLPQTHQQTHSLKDSIGLTVYRMDFAAKIKEKDGSLTQVIIELQKSRLLTTLKRFREYIGKQYSNPDLFVTLKTLSGKEYKAGIPVYAIYFLGYQLDKYTDIPVIAIENTVTDHYTRTILDKTDPFVTSLFHEGLIINIPALKKKRRDKIEQMLSIFENSMQGGMHILEINLESYPPQFKSIITRLQAAAGVSRLQDQMKVEDDIMEEIGYWERKLQLEKAKNKKSIEKIQRAEQKAKEAEQKTKEAEQKTKEAEQKIEEEKQQKEVLIRMIAANGKTTDEIAAMTGMKVSDVESILKK
jgi:hypothetical protein